MMASNEILEQRLRDVERKVTEVANGPASPEPSHFVRADRSAMNFADAHRSAEEMIQLIKEKHEQAGA